MSCDSKWYFSRSTADVFSDHHPLSLSILKYVHKITELSRTFKILKFFHVKTGHFSKPAGFFLTLSTRSALAASHEGPARVGNGTEDTAEGTWAILAVR